ncbi:hypothetical protein C8J57DRAFT_1221378 [Mycena rebaudengoi]|nr:hypothetical protein C8J57DRAFT_1221378 [Mycena rebaudengoi]
MVVRAPGGRNGERQSAQQWGVALACGGSPVDCGVGEAWNGRGVVGLEAVWSEFIREYEWWLVESSQRRRYLMVSCLHELRLPSGATGTQLGQRLKWHNLISGISGIRRSAGSTNLLTGAMALLRPLRKKNGVLD